MANPFQPAVRGAVPVKLGLVGPSGSGKTYSALRIARGIAGPDGRVALIDTEHGSASLYADQFQFDTLTMAPPYTPSRFADGIKVAANAGYDVVIIDGISPAWNGPGGVMEIVDQEKLGQNKFSGWAKGSPAHQQLVQGILSAPVHLICTMRSKTAWVVGANNKPERVGLEPVQRDGIDYEFSVVGELDVQHRLRVTKSRLRELAVDEVIAAPGEELGAALVLAVSAGESPSAQGARPAPPQPSVPTHAAASADGDAETDRAHAQTSILDVADPDRKLINKAQIGRLEKIAAGAGVSTRSLLAVVDAITDQPTLEGIERRLYDRVVAEVQLVGAGAQA